VSKRRTLGSMADEVAKIGKQAEELESPAPAAEQPAVAVEQPPATEPAPGVAAEPTSAPAPALTPLPAEPTPPEDRYHRTTIYLLTSQRRALKRIVHQWGLVDQEVTESEIIRLALRRIMAEIREDPEAVLSEIRMARNITI
jgi:hypothetical protein